MIETEHDIALSLQQAVEGDTDTFLLKPDEDEEQLGEQLEQIESEGKTPFITTRSYKDAGILTRDAGFVLTLPGGAEFQITIKRSR